MKKVISWRKKLLFSMLPLVALFLGGELAIRAHRGKTFDFANTRNVHFLKLLSSAYPAIYHPRLGFVPRPGASGTENQWGTVVTIDQNGIRINGDDNSPGTGSILAVGDSFTFGDHVSDHETWPAHLQRITGRPVLNAGVFGYGFDQSVLRAEELAPVFKPEILIVGLIPDDVARCELACRYAWKPYFQIEDGKLILKNVPVPRAPMPKARFLFLGYSHLADFFFHRAAYRWWKMTLEIRVHDQGPEVVKLLVDRLLSLSKEHDCRLLILIQDQAGPMMTRELHAQVDAQVQPIVERAEKRGVKVLNLITVLRVKLRENPELKKQWFKIHMTSEGNAWVAEQIAKQIK